MSLAAKLYITCTAAIGLAILTTELLRWSAPNLMRYLFFLLLAIVASTLKVRLPGFTSTVSASFVFVLVGVADYSLAETLIVGCVAALVQSLWKAKSPKVTQVVFNVASWALSVEVTYRLSHRAVAAFQVDSLAVLLPLAISLFFVTHISFVAGAVCLTSNQAFKSIWRDCYYLTFPYYLVGAAIAGIFSMSSRTVGWQVSLLVLPIMYLVYGCYRLYITHAVQREPAH